MTSPDGRDASAFRFVCRYCGGARFTRTLPARWEEGAVYADARGTPRFRPSGGGGPLPPPERAEAVACDNGECRHFNRDVTHLLDIVRPGPACWLSGDRVTLAGIPTTVATIEPEPHAPLVHLRDGRTAHPADLTAEQPPQLFD